MSDIFIRVLLGFVAGWLFGFLMTRSALKTKYVPQGSLILAYDVDDPSHPAMGLEVESLHYILTHESVMLTIEKRNFPQPKSKSA